MVRWDTHQSQRGPSPRSRKRDKKRAAAAPDATPERRGERRCSQRASRQQHTPRHAPETTQTVAEASSRIVTYVAHNILDNLRVIQQADLVRGVGVQLQEVLHALRRSPPAQREPRHSNRRVRSAGESRDTQHDGVCQHRNHRPPTVVGTRQPHRTTASPTVREATPTEYPHTTAHSARAGGEKTGNKNERLAYRQRLHLL